MLIKFFSAATNRDFGMRNRHSFGGKSANEETIAGSAKPFGIGKVLKFSQLLSTM